MSRNLAPPNLAKFDDNRRLYPSITEPERGWPLFVCVLALIVEAATWFRYDVPGGHAVIIFQVIFVALIISSVASWWYVVWPKDHRDPVLVRYAASREGQNLLVCGDSLTFDYLQLCAYINFSNELSPALSEAANALILQDLKLASKRMFIRSVELGQAQEALKDRIRSEPLAKNDGVPST